MEVGGESEESHLMREHIPDNLRVLPSPDLHEGSEVEGGGAGTWHREHHVIYRFH